MAAEKLATDQIYLKSEGITKRFSKPEIGQFTVLKDIDLKVMENEFLSILGPSGCGKTTLLNVFAGLVEPDEGLIEFRGQQLDFDDISIGYVFQEPRLLDWKTVGGNIKFAMESVGIESKEYSERTDKYLNLVGLGSEKESFPKSLSGGMKQRVAIARALAIEPSLFLMDEPFSELDEFTARKARADLIDIWNDQKRTVIFVTHNLQEAIFLSDRIVLMSPNPGRIVAEFDIDIGRPRRIEGEDVIDHTKKIYSEFKKLDIE